MGIEKENSKIGMCRDWLGKLRTNWILGEKLNSGNSECDRNQVASVQGLNRIAYKKTTKSWHGALTETDKEKNKQVNMKSLLGAQNGEAWRRFAS
jgi:hypothetical protein